jgi:sigma-54 dependent transcriptional regulator, acetoin dehydrogenase operon transcriptional activator AcoR
MENLTATQHAASVLRFVDGLRTGISCQVVSNTVGDSWQRCALEYSLDPTRRYEPRVLEQHTLDDLRARHAELVQIASGEIDWLYEHIAESGYALLLTDANGIVLYEKTDESLRAMFRSAGLMMGADWSEAREGTNGIGTCIAEERPVIVHLEEHFRACHIRLSCAGAPIRDPAGALIAVLDASTVNAHGGRADRAHTMALVDLSAQLIEKCLFLRHFQHGPVLRFHARPEFVNLQHDGALALASDATVIAADKTALRLLGAASRSELIGRRIDELFDVHLDDLLVGESAARPVRDALLGRRFFASFALGAQTSRRPRAAAVENARSVLQLTPTTARKSHLTLEELAGEDPHMLRNVRSVRRIADSRVPVMIQGATGTGKEVFARALHAASERAEKPFVALNCAAIPESLIESELFGYKPGAFTGARKEGMRGKILQSSSGTLFLDEIGDMPLTLQTRLLRVLEEQEVVPLGAEAPLKVDLRVVCASHQNLRSMIVRNLFREDLYYRLNGITIELPPLAQRTDKERLIREFLTAETTDGRPAAIEMDAFRCLLAYGWPGNIRELRNVIRTALAICDGGVVRLRDLPSEVRDDAARAALEDTQDQPSQCTPLQAAERRALMQAVQDCGGNMSRAAQLLGISRNTLYRRCKRLQVPLHGGADAPL